MYVTQELPQTSTCSHLHGRRRLEPVSRGPSPRHDRFTEVPHRLHHKVIYSDSSGAAFHGKYARAGSVYGATRLKLGTVPESLMAFDFRVGASRVDRYERLPICWCGVLCRSTASFPVCLTLTRPTPQFAQPSLDNYRLTR